MGFQEIMLASHLGEKKKKTLDVFLTLSSQLNPGWIWIEVKPQKS